VPVGRGEDFGGHGLALRIRAVTRPTYSSTMGDSDYTEDQRQALWEQFCDVYTDQQEAFDSSVRTLAAAGVAVTASLGTALDGLAGWGVAAIAVFLVSLGANLVSHVTSQFDMKARLNVLREGRMDGIERNRWTTATTAFNVLAGVSLVAGGACLATFVSLSA
jgi:hypothetical protein